MNLRYSHSPRLVSFELEDIIETFALPRAVVAGLLVEHTALPAEARLAVKGVLETKHGAISKAV